MAARFMPLMGSHRLLTAVGTAPFVNPFKKRLPVEPGINCKRPAKLPTETFVFGPTVSALRRTKPL